MEGWGASEWGEGGEQRVEKPFSAVLPAVDAALWEDMKKYLAERELDFGLAVKNGWYPTSSVDGRPRVVIPATSRHSDNRYWQARVMKDEEGVRRYESPSAARGDAIVVVVPYGEAAGVGMVEGPMDALAAAGLGLLGLAWMGTSPPEEALVTARFFLSKTNNVVIADEGAWDEALRIWLRFPGALFASTYPHKDLAAMPLRKREENLGWTTKSKGSDS